MDLFYTPEEIARALKVSPETVRLRLRRGELEGMRFGRSWRIPRKEALRLLGEETLEELAGGSVKAGAGSGQPDALDEIRARLARHQDELRRRFGVRVVGVFGSYARGEADPASDVDLLVALERPLGWELVDVKAYLEEALGRPVDLVTQGSLRKSPRLRREVEEALIRV